MEPDSHKIRMSQEQQTRQEEAALQKSSGLEFQTADEVIRYDAAQTPPPQRIERRVRDSVNREEAERLPWWRRWFGG